jgi:hypothetical protein
MKKHIMLKASNANQKDNQIEVNIFLMADPLPVLSSQNTPNGYHNIERMMKLFC